MSSEFKDHKYKLKLLTKIHLIIGNNSDILMLNIKPSTIIIKIGGKLRIIINKIGVKPNVNINKIGDKHNTIINNNQI